MKNKVQGFGKFLSGMIMPNIGALIAFGFLAALFIDTGWIPYAPFQVIHSCMLAYLIPILIACQGGYMVGGDRGRVIGGIAVVGAIMSNTDVTMLMAAMVMGPLAGWVIKKFDQAMDGHMPAGFEMLINNFSVGIFGMILAILGFVAIGPIMSAILAVLSAGVQVLVDNNVLPLVSILIEPAKVLFLNNAINHGIFSPIAAQQAQEVGKSILYMLETNPGPGLGVILAYWAFCKDKATRDSAPGAVIIHLFGGIHEIYFPYILMNPIVIVGPILGNMAAILFFVVTNSGLVGPPSPGSIIAFLMMSQGSQIPLSLIGIAIAAVISFLISGIFVRRSNGKSLSDAQDQMAGMKAEAKGIAAPTAAKASGEIKKIIFACDAGMGSSAMGATKFRNRIKGIRPDITVTNSSVDNVPADADVVVTQVVLQDRARKSAPQAQVVTINNFLADPSLDALYAQVTTAAPAEAPAAAPAAEAAAPKKSDILVKEGVMLKQSAATKEEAIEAAGKLLNKLGYVDASYIDAMQEREKLTTTYMGMGIAIPHGTTQAKGTVKKSGIVVLQYPDGVPFGDEKAYLVFGIAGVGDEHLDILSKICEALEDEDTMNTLKTATDPEVVVKTLS